MDWKLDPENQKKYDEVVTRNRILQDRLGITPRTIEERARDYKKLRQEEELKKQELAKLTNRRPPPKWKV